MHDFNCANADEMNFKLMAERTKYLKEHPKGASEMCKVIEDLMIEEREEALQEGRKEGREEGIKETSTAAALRMLADNALSLEKIAEYVGLSIDEVRRLQAEQST